MHNHLNTRELHCHHYNCSLPSKHYINHLVILTSHNQGNITTTYNPYKYTIHNLNHINYLLYSIYESSLRHHTIMSIAVPFINKEVMRKPHFLKMNSLSFTSCTHILRNIKVEHILLFPLNFFNIDLVYILKINYLKFFLHTGYFI